MSNLILKVTISIATKLLIPKILKDIIIVNNFSKHSMVLNIFLQNIILIQQCKQRKFEEKLYALMNEFYSLICEFKGTLANDKLNCIKNLTNSLDELKNFWLKVNNENKFEVRFKSVIAFLNKILNLISNKELLGQDVSNYFSILRTYIIKLEQNYNTVEQLNHIVERIWNEESLYSEINFFF